MCAKNNNIYAWREQAIREIAKHWSLLLLAATTWSFAPFPLGFPIATKWCCDQDVEVVPSSAFTQRTCDRVWFVVFSFSFQNGGMLLQPLRWRYVDCVIHHERDVREEQQQQWDWYAGPKYFNKLHPEPCPTRLTTRPLTTKSFPKQKDFRELNKVT